MSGSVEALLPSAPTKPGFSFSPDVEELRGLAAREGVAALSRVEGFVVQCAGYGEICFLEPVDVRGLDIDTVVEFKHGQLFLYDGMDPPPPVGEGLKKKADVTLEGVGTSKPGVAARAKFERKIAEATQKLGAELLEYNPETRVWRFRMQL